jgi:hypothetical protein
MDAEQLGAYVRTRCTRSVSRMITIGRAEVPVRVADGLDVVRRCLVLVPDGSVPVPRRAADDPEEVRHVHPAAAGAGPDLVLVDDRYAVRLLHDDHGRFTTAVEVPGGELDRYRFRWDLAWSAAVIPQPPVPPGR